MRILFLTSISFFLLTTSFCQPSEITCGDPLIDLRDGKVYETVMIGSQCWMAQNLNVGIQVSNLQQTNNKVIEKTCYENNPDYCVVFGGLYIWDEAMHWTSLEMTQGICPDGWHLPSNLEWEILNEYLGIKETGTHMKVSKNHDPPWDGDNSSGFSALSSGSGYEHHFGRMGDWAVYWTSTEAGNKYAWFTQLDNYWAMDKYTILYQGNYYLKENGFSVRCIQDQHQ